MRRSSQSLLIYVLFGILIAVFIINFAPQSMGGCEGRLSNVESDAANIGGRVVSAQDFRLGFMFVGGDRFSPQQAKQRRLRETVMDRLIERELLAQEAERIGFRISDEEVEDQIAVGKMLALSQDYFGRIRTFEQPLPLKDGKFDYEAFKRFSLNMGMSPRAFIEEQRREMLAERVRGILTGGLHISPDELKETYVKRSNQVKLEYLSFPFASYENEVEPTAAEIEAYAKANEAKLKEKYTQNKFLYEKVNARKLRVILVKTDPGASADAEAAAKKKADALLARVKKGEAFAAVAKAASEDADTKGRGGLRGWATKDTTNLGPGLEAKVWAAKEGEVIGPEKAANGYYLVVSEGHREGDLAFDTVRSEMAEQQLRKDKAKARAKADADAALAKAKGASGKTLKDLFPAPSDKDKDKEKNKLADAVSTGPRAEETDFFIRHGSLIEGIGQSPELMKASFALTTEAPFFGPLELSERYYVIRLKERKNADMAEFEKKKLEMQRAATQMKAEEVLAEWTQRRCVEAKDANRLVVNRELLRYPEGLAPYEPCMPVRF
ncbi:MAG TPA: SurA N-terminal domain-containing protein [Polyangia bacterium]|nr:SurA N-terminal domain-containing protein [Polyangia bacterium]